MTGPPERPLTDTQLEVLAYIADGWSYRRVGEWLGITAETARSHVAHANARLPPSFAPDAPMQKRVTLWYLTKRVA